MLIAEIRAYTKFYKSIYNEKPFLINRYCIEVNHTTSRFVIDGKLEPEILKRNPYHFICKVDNCDVFFTMLSSLVQKDCGKRNFFALKENDYIKFIKEYLPGYYKDPTLEQVTYFDDLELFYLTFVNGELVKKEIRTGAPWW